MANRLTQVPFCRHNAPATLSCGGVARPLYPSALARLKPSPPVGKGWQYEVKFDGYTAQLHKAGQTVAIFAGTEATSLVGFQRLQRLSRRWATSGRHRPQVAPALPAAADHCAAGLAATRTKCQFLPVCTRRKDLLVHLVSARGVDPDPLFLLTDAADATTRTRECPQSPTLSTPPECARHRTRPQ